MAGYVKLQTSMPHHPKVIALSDAAFALHIRGICYCGEHLTDGHVPRAVAGRMGRPPALAELERAELWARDETGWQIHDYLDYQQARAEVEGERARNNARLRRYRQRKRNVNDAAFHERSEAPMKRKGNGVRNGGETVFETAVKRESSGVRNGVRNGGETLPDQDLDLTGDLDLVQVPPLTPPTGETLRGRFDRWWAVYPRHRRVGKQAAWRVWQRLKPTEVLLEQMLAVLALQKQSQDWVKDQGKFVPHPATYLNQGRWEDENAGFGQPSGAVPPPALEFEKWDWCAACDDAHPVGKCPKAGAA